MPVVPTPSLPLSPTSSLFLQNTKSAVPSENAQAAAVIVPAPSELANTNRVTDFFSASVKCVHVQGKRVRTSELELCSPGKFLNLDNVQELRDEDATVEMLVACVTRIRALEAELESSKPKKASTSGTPSAAKKARTEADTTGTAAPTQVVNKKQKDMILKRLGTGTKQALKGVKFFAGYDCTSRDAKTSDMISKGEFDAVFTGGTLTQPTPENKPSSKVYIREYTCEQASEMLGSTLSTLKGELWAKGGAPSRSFGFFGGGGGGFAKGKKLGSTPVRITRMRVQYSAPSQQLSVSVTLINGSGEQSSYGSDDDGWC